MCVYECVCVCVCACVYTYKLSYTCTHKHAHKVKEKTFFLALVGWLLLNAPATCQCISGTDLYGEKCMLPQ